MSAIKCQRLTKEGKNNGPSVTMRVNKSGNNAAVKAPMAMTNASPPAGAASTTAVSTNVTASVNGAAPAKSAAASTPPPAVVNEKAPQKAAVNAIVARIKDAANTATTLTDLQAFNKLIGEYDVAIKAVKGDATPTPTIGNVSNIPAAVKASAASIEAAAAKSMAGGRRKTHRKKHGKTCGKRSKTHKKHGKRSTKHHKKHGKHSKRSRKH